MSGEFSRFNQIFGLGSSNKKPKSPATPVPNPRKRQRLPVFCVTPKASGHQSRFESPSSSKILQVVESPDKQAILPHLSCNAEDFEKDLAVESDDSSEKSSK